MPDQPVHEPSVQLSGAATTVPLTPTSWDAVVNGLQRAADWTEGDIDCDDCHPERPCELHAEDRAEIQRWRELASGIDAVASRHRGARPAR